MKFYNLLLSAAAGITLAGLSGCCSKCSAPAPALAPAPAPAAAPAPVQTFREDVKLLLPDKIYAVPGVETNIYFENAVCVINPANYIFEAKSSYGRTDEKRWRYTPTGKEPASFPLTISVIGSQGVLAKKTVTVETAPANAGQGKAVTLMILGDSLTNAGVYPRRIHELTGKHGNPQVRQVGSHSGSGRMVRPGGVAHDGYSGWTWARFLNQWKDDAAFAALKTPHDIAHARSPFLRMKNGRLTPDVKAHFQRVNGGKAPDFITILLGVNDIFPANDGNVDKMIADIFRHMDRLLAELRKAAPDAVIGVGLPTAGAFSQDAFGKSYQSRFSRWQYKKNQHRLVAAMIQKFAESNPYRVELVPVYLNLDCENNFPLIRDNINAGNVKRVYRQNNGVHPAPEGYRQIGDTFFCWMKNVLARRKAERQNPAK